MKPTQKNYEEFFLDYLDGKLAEGGIHELMEFLEENPDLQSELEAFRSMELVGEAIQFKGKEFLKKELIDKTDITQANFDEFCIAYYEGELNSRQENKLREFVFLHPDSENDFNLFGKLNLRPDKALVYPEKQKLKKGRKIFLVSQPVRLLAVAASLALLATLYFTTRSLNPDMQAVHAPSGSGGNNTGSLSPENAPPDLGKIAGLENTVPSSVKNDKKSERKDLFVVNIIQQSGPSEKETLFSALKPIPAPLIDLEEPNIKPALPTKTTESKGISPAYNTQPVLSVSEFAVKEFREKVLADAPDTKSHHIGFWDIAGAGIRGINRITGSHIRFDRRYSSNGELVAVIVDSKNFGFTKSIKNN